MRVCVCSARMHDYCPVAQSDLPIANRPSGYITRKPKVFYFIIIYIYVVARYICNASSPTML